MSPPAVWGPPSSLGGGSQSSPPGGELHRSLLALGRSLQAQGVRQWAVQQCRTPDAAAWRWTAGQQEALAQGWHGFTLRTA